MAPSTAKTCSIRHRPTVAHLVVARRKSMAALAPASAQGAREVGEKLRKNEVLSQASHLVGNYSHIAQRTAALMGTSLSSHASGVLLVMMHCSGYAS
mmetsp:Transcript_35185/g.101115  ORF Transcript_35185/g.101115 Transcript_35185/m.101115 type:complete len:97 (-) Transcript_35185:68-358(-)